MHKIVVNPQQYITCRLCLEEQGVYQIIPTVKEQIFYCFGIEIEPFDGLSQVICGKCEKILCDFTETKENFIVNQVKLKTKVNNSLSDANKENSTKDKKEYKNKRKSKKRRIISNSSDESNEDQSNVIRKSRLSSTSNDFPLFPNSYNRLFICRICNASWSNIHLVSNHVHKKHGDLYKKYGHIITRHCQVSIPKTNLGNTDRGFRDKIMFCKDKIVKSVPDVYFITYTTRNYKEERNDSGTGSAQTNGSRQKNKYNICSDTSDDEETSKQNKRKSLSSGSSNGNVSLDTIQDQVSDDKQEDISIDLPPPKDLGECIMLDDSSDNDSEKSGSTLKTNLEIQDSFVKPTAKPEPFGICDIIRSCQNRFTKKHYPGSFSVKSARSSMDTAIHLKRKVLSIGRKIITKKKSANCTPLIRFIENKCLDMELLRQQVQLESLESDSIRILARTKNFSSKKFHGYGYLHPPMPISQPQVFVISNSESAENRVYIDEINDNGVQINGIQLLPATIHEIVVDSNIVSGKILNANPVANPKQLPRKIMDVKNLITAPNVVPVADVAPQELGDSQMRMPVIMSTASLAMPFKVSADTATPAPPNNNNIEQSAEAPRIKVKPVSELMSAESLKRMATSAPAPAPTMLMPQQVSVNGEVYNVYMPRVSVCAPRNPALSAQLLASATPALQRLAPAPLAPQQLAAAPPAPELSASAPQLASPPAGPLLTSGGPADYLVLNSVELPNKRTNSPFNYFKTLLQMHNLTLLDTHAELSPEFHCLIKFKVMYKQDLKNQPVVLCLALHCARNVFCFKIRDRNLDNIDMLKITANWQWEVLKIFKGEVVGKVLQSAQKIGLDQYEYANKFLCILKCIDLVR